MEFKLSEHSTTILYPRTVSLEPHDMYNQEYLRFSSIVPRVFKNNKGKSLSCFELYAKGGIVSLEANYYIGLDWLIPGESFVQVLPKVNSRILQDFIEQLDLEEPNTQKEKDEVRNSDIEEAEVRELNYLKMFLDAMAHPVVASKLDGLILIDWEAPKIRIEQQQDMLTPFLILHFLKLLKDIVRKGLKKSYYKVHSKLNNRVRGKLLVSEHIKRNIVKHRFTSTYCEYQEFGVDSTENQFLKKVLQFVVHYVASNKAVFKGTADTIDQMINFCSPAFEQVSGLKDMRDLKHIKSNPFFREYKEAIRIGDYILKRFSYNITDTVNQRMPTPPFWIDMPLLFELYTYSNLLDVFETHEIEYHHRTYGNELDFLIKRNGAEMVVDAKYKMHYKASHIHSDIRQVSGYARLKTVYEALGIKDRYTLVDCLIIYPSSESKQLNFDMSRSLNEKSVIKAYERLFKLGIPMPWIHDDPLGS